MPRIEDTTVRGDVTSVHIYREEIDGTPCVSLSMIIGTSRIVGRDVDIRRSFTMVPSGPALAIITDISYRGWDRKYYSVKDEERFHFYCRTLEISDWLGHPTKLN